MTEFTIRRPILPLQKYIECIRVAESEKHEELHIKTCPSGFPGMIFQIAADGTVPIRKIVTRSHTTTQLSHLFAHSLVTEPSVLYFKRLPFTTIQIVFKPFGFYGLLGIDATLINGSLDANQLHAADLERELCRLTGTNDRIDMLQDFLLDQQTTSGVSEGLLLVEKAVAYIDANLQDPSIKSILAELQTTDRYLQKMFAKIVGCSPKQFIRIKRINAAVALMHSGKYQHLSDIAYVLGYYDQSHFIRDVKDFSWLTPKSLHQRVDDFRQDETGISYL